MSNIHGVYERYLNVCRRMIGFRTHLPHMKNLWNSAFLCYKVDKKSFYCGTNFAFRSTIGSFDNYFKANSTHFCDIVDSALFKECNNDTAIIKRLKDTTKRKSISVCTFTHKDINKRLSHFGASSLFVRNHCIIQNNCNAKHMSSFFGISDNNVFTNIFKHVSESALVGFTQESIVWLHSHTGLPWWATIITTTLAIRMFITLPLALYQHYIFAKIEMLNYEMEHIIKNVKRENIRLMQEFNWPEEYSKIACKRAINKEWNQLIVRDNCHPMKTVVLILVQIPLWVSLSVSWRNLCTMLPIPSPSAYEIYLELTTGGFGWILNLAEVDSYWILPVSAGLLNLIIIEIQTLIRIQKPTRFVTICTNFSKFLSIALIPIAAYLPSAVSLYWTTSSFWGLCQNLLLLSPKVRRLARIPETEHELSHPYSHMYERMRNKYNFIGRQ